MKKSSIAWGVIFILFGGLLLYDNMFNPDIISMKTLWPLFVLGPGLIFEFSFFVNRKAPGLLVPGGILTTNGFMFLFQTFTNWQFIGYTWPIFIFSVAIGLFQLYLFIGKPKGLLIPIFILTTVACVSFTIGLLNGINSFINLGLVIPMTLIILGIYLLFFKPQEN
ncbi:MAG: hypothetical protein GX660_20075 [Clostridiaceae bacterium]|nr:hypothetical protein [Clostridiaceae bacterium]